MSKLIRFLMFVAVISSLISGCSKPASTPTLVPTAVPATLVPKATTVPEATPTASIIALKGTVFFPYDDPPFWQQQGKRWEATGYQMNYQVVPFTQLFNKYQTSLLGGERLDVIHVHDLWATTFGSMGLLRPLNDRITPEMIAQYPPGLFDKLSIADSQGNKQIVAMPLYLWTTNFYYRKDIFEANGVEVPKTFTEMRTLAKKLQGVAGADVYPFMNALGGSASTSMFCIVLRGEGGEILTDGKPSFNNEKGLAALEEIVGLVKDGSVDPASFTYNSGSQICEPFAQGKAMMIFGPPPTLNFCNNPDNSKVVGKVEFALMPGGSKNASASVHETGGRAIPITSQDPEAAWNYIQFVTSPDEVKQMTIALGRVPASLEVLNNKEVIEKYPIVTIIPEQLTYPSGMPVVHPKGVEISKVLADEIVSACMGQKTPQQALSDAETKVNAILVQ